MTGRFVTYEIYRKPQPYVAPPAKTTADCVEYLADFYDNTNASDWKRRSKKNEKVNKHRTYIVRVFENTSTGVKVELKESNGDFSFPRIIQPDGRSKYLCGIGTIKVDDEDDDGILTITTREGWDKDHCIDDTGYDEDLSAILDPIDVRGADECNFEIPAGRLSDLKKVIRESTLIDFHSGVQAQSVECGETYGFEYDPNETC